ncbi:ATPase [Salipiger pallidus]|uniref:ATPase n=1 Tax=Salipiger pallidus TaxID=1775170 RepID=A0A8J2ZLU5_9RHOB|nr:TIGR02302 family protein [Salipiger pallidus]GGG80182.1 ATPase [Salipiger pallidus]
MPKQARPEQASPTSSGPTSSEGDILAPVKWPLRLTLWGMTAERITRAFWPLWSIVIAALAALMLGLQDLVMVEWVWGTGAVALAGAGWAAWRGIRMMRLPTRAQAISRLDGSMTGNPIQAALDDQAIGAADMGSQAVWDAHQSRMRKRLAAAKAVQPDLRVARADPFALRYVALLALAAALIFGSVLRVSSVTAMGPSGSDLASGPAWEGWMEPPGYTRMPAVYLNDITAPGIDVPEGAQITLRMYGEVGALSVEETVSGRDPNPDVAQDTAQEFAIARSGRLAIDGPGGRAWDISVTADTPPTIRREGEIESSYEGDAQIPFAATDDYGVVAGTARIELALDEVNRSYLLAAEPEAREAIEVQLPMPIAGDRTEFTEALVENFSQHAWANLPVTISMRVEDEAGQVGETAPEVITLPGRRFFDPLAAAVIEQRRALLWTRDNAPDVAQILRAISYLPDDAFRSAVPYLKLRHILRQVEGDFTTEARDEVVQAMWDLAIELEEGDLASAQERLQRAQERLEEAMKNGASEQEIAELMQELREATDDYLRQLSRQAQQQGDQNPEMSQSQDMVEMSQNDLQGMMDRIQELMEEGRMDEAAEALRQLQEMMENMQVTQGQQGQSSGEQAMEGLGETLREQQGLSDEAFRELQEQYNPGQQGQQGQQGMQGQQGQGQQGQQQGQGEDGQQGQGGQQSLEDSLAQRQQQLRNELNRQSQNLPGAGTEAGEAARDQLGRAGEAMDGAEEALRDGDLPGAIDRQSQAMEALREGMRSLGEAMAQQGQQQGEGQQGQMEGGDPGQQRDPLGRNAGANGQLGSDESMVQDEDVYRRARELLDEIRRRSGDGERPQEELDYLERLLERF